mmetsp:Transcript_6661/g.15200  ORF Transcript_6661/g.15200 Transcript_6661/m.15200 type:complete len:115 (-) Transcript_6661:1187-1531(-)|eukprot:CAMPEP_0116827156 /NCGR_PEP_ID=MMETSP0418-20121206/2937_1 /TAXON_ID=1158023 /ORGANISM="Astrosyne radiata, Strain 13vi08-1A" /LENGTH=114 /DNA_ID=CAMNT_0004455889 /DNA_START=1336 /DNA_END=1680 /DNA_ORIENTATION=-
MVRTGVGGLLCDETNTKTSIKGRIHDDDDDISPLLLVVGDSFSSETEMGSLDSWTYLYCTWYRDLLELAGGEHTGTSTYRFHRYCICPFLERILVGQSKYHVPKSPKNPAPSDG